MTRTRRLFGWRFWVGRGVVALVLGVVTTVGVAWGLAAWWPLDDGSWAEYRVTDPNLRSNEWVGVVEVRAPVWVRRSWRWEQSEVVRGFEEKRLRELQLELDLQMPPELLLGNWSSARFWFPPDPSEKWSGLSTMKLTVKGGDRSQIRGAEDARGWPWLSMWCFIDDGRWKQEPIRARGGIELPTRAKPVTLGNFRALPLRPVWPGFLWCTLVYASAWAMLLIGPTYARRARRIVRGRCPKCAYDLAWDLRRGCPECGWGAPTSTLEPDA